MKWKNSPLPTRLNLIASGILLAGLGSAAAIYLAAGDAAESGLGEYAPENSKMYLHDLELYGGKANLLANELMTWFDGLWHGKTLAYTVACIAVVICCGLFYAARQLPSNADADDRDDEC